MDEVIELGAFDVVINSNRVKLSKLPIAMQKKLAEQAILFIQEKIKAKDPVLAEQLSFSVVSIHAGCIRTKIKAKLKASVFFVGTVCATLLVENSIAAIVDYQPETFPQGVVKAKCTIQRYDNDLIMGCVKVKEGDTLSEILMPFVENKPFTYEQIAYSVQMIEANKKVFSHSNIDIIKSGSILHIPNEKVIRMVSQSVAEDTLYGNK